MRKLRWRKFGEKDKITANECETCHSQVERLSEEIVGLKNRHNGSAASTVAASSGSGGSISNFAAHVMPNSFIPTRVELKGWEVWRNIRGTGITMDRDRNLASKFNWELTDLDQGNLDMKMMIFLCFNECVTPHERKRIVRATLETARDKREDGTKRRRFSYAPCVKTPVSRGKSLISGGSRRGIRVSVNSATPGGMPVLSQVASITIGADWVLNRERLNSFVSGVDVDLRQTLLDDACDARRPASQPRDSLDLGSSCTICPNREKR